MREGVGQRLDHRAEATGRGVGGLPVGLHIIGDMGQESLVLRASAAFEQVRPWTEKRPPVS